MRNAQGLTFSPLHPVIGAECAGVDISQPITPEIAEVIHDSMDRYAVLVFRQGKPLTTEQQLRFARSLGELEGMYTKIEAEQGMRLETPLLSDISNLAPGDTLLPSEDRKRLFNLGNLLWHSDSSYKKIPAKYSALCAHVLPPTGGNTEFADMRAAWDMLDPAIKDQIKHLVAEQGRIFSKGMLGFQFTEKELHDFAPVRQPLVSVVARRVHRRHAASRGADAAARTHRTRDATRVCLQPLLARMRFGDVGQSHNPASRAALRRFEVPARHALQHHHLRRASAGVCAGAGLIPLVALRTYLHKCLF